MVLFCLTIESSLVKMVFSSIVAKEEEPLFTTDKQRVLRWRLKNIKVLDIKNDEKFVKMASKSIYFKNDAYFTRIKEYMGPPNSNPDKDDDVIHANTDFWEYLEEEEEEE